MHFTKLFRQYLLGRQFIIRTDHAALSWLQKTPEPIGQNARWLEQLGEYDYIVKHRRGASHSNADATSRHPCLRRPSRTACHPERKAVNRNVIAEAVEEESYISAVDYESDVDNEVEQSRGVDEVSSEAEDMLSWMVEEIREGQRRDKDISYVIVLMEKNEAKPMWNEVEL